MPRYEKKYKSKPIIMLYYMTFRLALIMKFNYTYVFFRISNV